MRANTQKTEAELKIADAARKLLRQLCTSDNFRAMYGSDNVTTALWDAVRQVWPGIDKDGRSAISIQSVVASYVHAKTEPIDDGELYIELKKKTTAGGQDVSKVRRFIAKEYPGMAMEKESGVDTLFYVAKSDEELSSYQDQGFVVIELRTRNTNGDDSERNNGN